MWQPIETAPRDGTKILVFPAYGATGKGGKRLHQADVAYWREMKRGPDRWEGRYGALPLKPREWAPLRAEPPVTE